MKTLLYLSKSKNMKIGIFTMIKLRLSNQHPEDTATGIVGKYIYMKIISHLSDLYILKIDMKPAPYLC